MIKLTVQFPSLELLAAFYKATSLKSYLILTNLFQITLYHVDKEMGYPVEKFKGMIVSKQLQ